MMKNVRLLIAFICLAMAGACAYGYFPSSKLIEEVKEIKYTEGTLDHYYTHWKYYRKWRRKGKPLRKYLNIYLEDDDFRYTDGHYLLDNLEQTTFVILADDYPRPVFSIGYIDTDDSYLKEIYDIKHDGMSIVDVDGIKSDLNRERLLFIIFSGVFALLGVLLVYKHFRKTPASS